MSNFAGNLPQKFFSFCHLGFKSSTHNWPEKQESANPKKVVGLEEVNTVVVSETSNSSAKFMSILQNVPKLSEIVTSRVVEKDHDLTVAAKDCVMTSSDEDMDDLNSFVLEKLQSMSEKGLEQLVGDESVNVMGILCESVAAVCSPNVGAERNVGIELIDQGRTTFACPGLTRSSNVEEGACETSSHGRDEVDRLLGEELGGSRAISTPVKGLWPIYSKRRSSVLGGHEAPPCKSIKYGVTGTIGALESGNLSRSCMTEVSGGMEESDFTGGGFSILEAIAKRRADDRAGGLYEVS